MHPEFISHESETDAEGFATARWGRWCDEAAEILCVPSLDGDQAADGYSLDWAHDRYLAGDSPHRFATRVLNGEEPDV